MGNSVKISPSFAQRPDWTSREITSNKIGQFWNPTGRKRKRKILPSGVLQCIHFWLDSRMGSRLNALSISAEKSTYRYPGCSIWVRPDVRSKLNVRFNVSSAKKEPSKLDESLSFSDVESL